MRARFQTPRPRAFAPMSPAAMPPPAGTGRCRSHSRVRGRTLGAALAIVLAVAAACERPAQPASSGASPAPLPESLDGFRADAWFLPDDDLLGFVEVPAGPFTMGSDPVVDPRAFENERWSAGQAQGAVELPAFAIGRYEVTVAQFRAFADATGGAFAPETLRGGLDRPVGSISWPDALAYCRGWRRRSATGRAPRRACGRGSRPAGASRSRARPNGRRRLAARTAASTLGAPSEKRPGQLRRRGRADPGRRLRLSRVPLRSERHERATSGSSPAARYQPLPLRRDRRCRRPRGRCALRHARRLVHGPGGQRSGRRPRRRPTPASAGRSSASVSSSRRCREQRPDDPERTVRRHAA